MDKELHGEKLLSGRGRYRQGKHKFTMGEANKVYRALLSEIGFLPDVSIITVAGAKGSSLFGRHGLEAAVIALFQRMGDGLHPQQKECLRVLRRRTRRIPEALHEARVYFPTGPVV